MLSTHNVHSLLGIPFFLMTFVLSTYSMFQKKKRREYVCFTYARDNKNDNCNCVKVHECVFIFVFIFSFFSCLCPMFLFSLWVSCAVFFLMYALVQTQRKSTKQHIIKKKKKKLDAPFVSEIAWVYRILKEALIINHRCMHKITMIGDKFIIYFCIFCVIFPKCVHVIIMYCN